MNTGVISKRYAKAFYELTQESGRGAQVYAQVREILNRQVPDKLEPDLQKLILLLQKNGRVDLTDYILNSFCILYRQNMGIVQARLSLAAPSPDIEDKLRTSLADKFGGEMTFETKIDPSLIGGFVLEVNDNVMDTSIKKGLNTIKARFDELNKRLV